MKKIAIIICSGLGILLSAAVACNQPGNGSRQMKNDTTPATFATTSEAAMQAREDLLEILRSDKGISLGIIDTAALADAVPGTPVPQYVIDFDKLLSADSASTFVSLQQEERNPIIPLMNEKRLVTVVEVSRHGEQWRIAALAGQSLSGDLSTVMAAIGNDSTLANKQISLYEVPNLGAKLFHVSNGRSEIVFTNYNHFSLRQGLPVSSILPVLKENAQRFQREFGDQVKKQKLVE